MGDFTEKKFQSMVDEMTRFEEEIGMPYKPKLEVRHPLVSRPFVIGTNTFSQAQRKILQIHDGVPMDPMFIPPQIIHAGPTGPVPGGIPPPPPPPLSAPPAGMTFPPRLQVPFGQTIPPPPQPPAFLPSMMMRSEATVPATPVSSASTVSFPRRPTPTTWPVKTPPFRPPTPTKTEPEPKPTTDSPPKVVLSATPKLYTPKVEMVEEMNYSNYSTRISMPEPPRSCIFNNRKPKPEPPKYTPVAPVDIYSQSATKKDKKKKKVIRVSGGQTWEDPTLAEWDDGDFRLFCGDLGNDVTDELLTRIFCKYPSFVKARVVRDRRTNKTKGYGFISFRDPQDFIRASKEMNGRYVGSRPIKLRKSTWKNRNLDTVKKKEKEKAALIALLTGKS